MKKAIVTFTAAILISSIAGCSIQRSPVTNIADISRIDFSDADSLKEASSCARYVFGIIGPFGDPSVMKAIKKGKLKTVKAVDYKEGYYILWSSDCVIVYGDKM